MKNNQLCTTMALEALIHEFGDMVYRLAYSYCRNKPDEQQLAEVLKQLPGKYGIVIHLYYYEGYSTEEIAGLLGKKPSTIRTQLTRAREILRKLLKEDDACLKIAIKE